MFLYVTGLVVLTVICGVMHLYTRTAASNTAKDASLRKFEQLYLVVYLLAMMGDWLQGPHVYALYDSYDMSKHEIELLFITGFGSSMLFGTIVGSFADKFGRRFNCILYGVLYGVGCVTKHFNNFFILMFGRLLAGIATSILYSAFESWLVYEHKNRGFSEGTLGTIFANAYFGNSIVAILAGIVAEYAANVFGYVAPFDISLLVLSAMVLIITTSWTENFGDSQAQLKQSFVTAWKTIKTDRKVLLLGLIQSLFEGSMYVFVLEWTPALSFASKQTIPHGFIFSAFMVAVMIGSNLFKMMSKTSDPESFMRPVLLVAAVTLALPIIFSNNETIIFISFIIFETCVGIFWPSMGTMRGRYVPETARSTIMNFFRIPLNFIVVVILLQDFDIKIIFGCCCVFLVLASLFQFRLNRLSITTRHLSSDKAQSSISKEPLLEVTATSSD